MLAEAAKWLIDSGALEKILESSGSAKDESLTVHDVRRELEIYKRELIERMDEDRLRQLHGGITLLRDAVRSAAATALVTQALQNFHEIAGLPREGRTGRFENRELICVACICMALAHNMLGDPQNVIAEKIVEAVAADPDATQRFFGKQVSNAICRQIEPSMFVPLGGSPREANRLFPHDRSYFVPVDADPRQHLWLEEVIGPITGAASYVIGLTHYSALLLASSVVLTGHEFPSKDSALRQMANCGKFVTVGQFVEIVAPLSGKVIDVNKEQAYVINMDTLAQDPYGSGWLFRVLPAESPGIFRRIDYNKEFSRLLTSEGYQSLLAKSSNPGTVCVESIRYDTRGGRYGDKDLLVTIALIDQFGRPVPGATVGGRLDIEGDWISFCGTTGQDGTLVYEEDDAPSATFKTLIDNVIAEGLIWGNHYSTPENKFRK